MTDQVQDSGRLLVVADTLNGGLGAAVLAQATWFRGRGWSVVLAAPAAPISGESPEGLHLISIPNRVLDARAMLRAARDLRGLLQSFGPSVVHCHGLRSVVATLLAGRRAFVTIHGPGALPGEAPMQNALRRAALSLLPRLALRTFSAAPGYDRWTFLPHASPKLHELDLLPFPGTDTIPTFLWVSRLESQKRGDLFVHAIAEAARQTRLRALVAGTGSLEPSLRRLAGALDAPIEFLGETSDLRRPLGEAWVGVLLSRFEAITFSLQEAMWAGRPVVASRLPGRVARRRGRLPGRLARRDGGGDPGADGSRARGVAR